MSVARRIGAGSAFSMLLLGGAVACNGSVSRSTSQACATRVAEADVAHPRERNATRQREPDATRPMGTSTTPCSHYFVAQYERCGGPVLPANEAARIRARFETMCRNEMDLPGSGMTDASLEACASALDAASCQLPGG